HVAPAHTDGDAIVRFVEANVIHMGDCFFNGRYPVIDVPAGGSIGGMIAATERAMPLMDDKTKAIPGHGPLGDKASLRAFHDMLVRVRERVKKGIANRQSRDEVLAGKPTAEFDAQWGKGFMKPEDFVGIVYSDLARGRK